MNIQIDVNGSIKRTMDATTKFGTFWQGQELPDNTGPAINHLLVIGLLPAAGALVAHFLMFIAGLIASGGNGFGFLFVNLFIGYTLMFPILMYALFVVMPVVLGMITAAIAPMLNIEKGDINSFATIFAYSLSPNALISGVMFVFLGIFGFIFTIANAGGIWWLFMTIGGLLGLAAAIIFIILLYNGYTQALGIDQGNAIILIVMQLIIYMIISAIIFGIIAAIFKFGMFGPLFLSGWR